MTEPDAFRPFENDTQVTTFTDGQGELSLENGTEAVLLTGQIEFGADAAGLARLQALQRALAAVEAAILARRPA